MNNKKTVLFLPIFTLLLSSCSASGKHYECKEYVAGTLKFKEDFRILQMTDVHLGNKDILEKHFDFMSKMFPETKFEEMENLGHAGMALFRPEEMAERIKK